MMEKKNVNGALKLLTNNISNGILSLDDKTLKLLMKKNPKTRELSKEIILSDEKPLLHSVIFKDTND